MYLQRILFLWLLVSYFCEKTMRELCRIHVRSNNISARIDAASQCTGCPWDIDCRKDTIAEQKTMRFLVGIGV
jgi:hypothetical protein